jgi:hypothetical protein
MTAGLPDAVARVPAGPESDLDVAVSFPRALSAMDLVSLASLLVAEPRALAEFQMYTPSRYFDWKITRRPIEEAMRASAAEMNQHFEEDFVLAKDLGDLEEFANEVLRKTTASG